MASILVYDKNSHSSSCLRDILLEQGYKVRCAFLLSEAETAVTSGEFNTIIASIDNFPLTPNLEKLKIIITAPMSKLTRAVSLAEETSALCLAQPYETDILISHLADISANRQEKKKAVTHDLMPEIIGESKETESIRESIRSASLVESRVMVLGETGTGKELVAKAIHRLGKRRDKPFVAINCGAIAETLLESELFGHARGAFTGAVKKHCGKFESANGGTLFLDEIGDMPLSLQVKLLRVLESGNFYPVGSNLPVEVDVRIISATNRNIFEMAENGSFRQDLLYRINVIPVNLSPLRQRRGDIEIIANHFLKSISNEYQKRLTSFSPKAIEQLKTHGWNGNIRELKHTIERAVAISKGSVVQEIEPSFVSSPALAQKGAVPDFDSLLKLDYAQMKESVLLHYEKEYIDALLSLEGGSIQRVHKRCNIDRKTLYRKMKQYGLDKKDYK